MATFHLSFRTTALWYSDSSFIFCPILLAPFFYGLTVPQQFMLLVCQSDVEMSCPHIICVPHFQSLLYICLQLHQQLSLRELPFAGLSCIQLSYMWAYISYSHTSCNFLPDGLYFVGVCCLKMTLLLKSMIILNAGCSVLLILSL